MTFSTYILPILAPKTTTYCGRGGSFASKTTFRHQNYRLNVICMREHVNRISVYLCIITA